MNVLIVDDDMVICKGISKIIEKSGLEFKVCAEASDGEIALQIIKESQDIIHLMITDIRMPVMDGLELIKQTRKIRPEMKIIVLSGFDDFEYVRNAFMDGAVDYLLKPMQKTDFIALLNKIKSEIQQEQIDEHQHQDNLRVVAANRLNHFIHKKPEKINEESCSFGCVELSRQSYYFICVIKIDYYYKQNLGQLEYIGEFEKVVKLLEDRNRETPGWDLVQFILGAEVVILVTSDKPMPVSGITNDLFQYLSNDKEHITYTMGISNLFQQVKNLPLAYEQASDAVESRFYLGKSSRIDYNDICDKILEVTCQLEEKAQSIAEYLELCDYIGLKKVLEQVFLDLSYAKAFVFRKNISDLFKMLFIRSKEFEMALLSSYHDYEFYIGNINTYNELRSYILTLFQGCIQAIKEERSKKGKKKIEIVKAYISQHYQEPLTLNQAAEYVELNPSYFSNFFKLEAGKNFSEYLLDTRIQAAKKLLKEPNIKIYEVGMLVGYEDAISFGRAFKKKIGMSPKEYRNIVS